jgi:hypothetical protein
MRVESRVTSLSWISSEAAKGMLRMGFSTHVAEYDDPSPDVIDADDSGVSVSPRRPARAVHVPPHFPIGPDGLNGKWRFLRSRTGCGVRRESNNVDDPRCQLGTVFGQGDR